MRHVLLIATILWATTSNGQTLGKGIYNGQTGPFTTCYLTYSDSTIEVEYFYKKAGQIFGHVPAKKLEIEVKGSASKAAFKSADDSITVYDKSEYYLVKRPGEKVKVYKSNDTQATISTLRNRNKLFSFSHNLYAEYQVKPNFVDQNFWDKLNAYELDKFIDLENDKFNAKLDETREDFKKNWL